METFKNVIDILSAFLTPIIAIIGTKILSNQYRLEKQQWRLALYDKRYAVFLAVSEHLANIVATHNVTNDELFNFLRKTRDKEFLFGEDIHQFIEQVYLKSVDLNTVETELRNTPVGEERTKQVEYSREIFDWLKSQFDTSRTLFGEYLKINEK